MSRYFDVKITGGTTNGPFSIYYNTISPTTYAYISNTILFATGVTYSQLTTGNGFNVEIPNTATTIIVNNNSVGCNYSYTMNLPTQTPTPTPTLTI